MENPNKQKYIWSSISISICLEFCDHSSANKDQQGKGFNPGKDPEVQGWFNWTSIDGSDFFIELKTDSSIEFYGFDLWILNFQYIMVVK